MFTDPKQDDEAGRGAVKYQTLINALTVITLVTLSVILGMQMRFQPAGIVDLDNIDRKITALNEKIDGHGEGLYLLAVDVSDLRGKYEERKETTSDADKLLEILGSAEEANFRPTLKLGDVAPPARPTKVFPGSWEPSQDAITIIEFWATWCGPCRATIPHLAELQEKYQEDLRLIGVTSDSVETITKYLEGQQTINYTIAIDGTGKIGEAYMGAAGFGSIPTCFVIGKDRTIRYMGKPDGIDGLIDKLISE